MLAGIGKVKGLPELAIKANYDMLVESRAGAVVDMYARGFKLDAHLRATLGPEAMKTGDGGDAPALYQAGKIGELVSYCMADVHRERMLFEHVWSAGNLACDHNGWARHAVRRPQEALGLPMSFRLSDIKNMVKADAGPMFMGVDLAKPGETDRTVETKIMTTNPEDL